MALNDTYAPSSGIWNAVKGAMGIFSSVNKAEGVTENSNPTPEEEYESKISDAYIIELVGNWKRTYSTYYSEIEGSQKTAFAYWIGKQDSDEAENIMGNRSMIDNLIFEAIETFIPIATRANPDPLVTADPSDAGQQLAHAVKSALVSEADKQKLRKKLKRVLRDWMIYKIGVLKFKYNVVLDRIETDCINPKRMLFDKDGHIDEGGFFVGEYVGEKIKLTANKLCEMFPKKKDYILEQAKGKKGTKMEFIEWWYHGTDVFYTMEQEVLGKFKNPHWNYDSQDGTINGTNHLDEPLPPYGFLSIFSTGLQPHDETGLIQQNVGMQDMINRRIRQIDDNVRKMNNGMVISDKFTDSQASQAASAMARGTAIRAPGDDVTKAVMRMPAPALPPQVFQMLEDGRQELKNIFGTSGSTPQGVNDEDTVRGKIMVSQMDSSRIGGGITEHLEQLADTAYNWWVQMMFVHYTDEHYVIDSGETDAQNLITIKSTDFLMLKTLNITVKEGSLIPKDPMTQRNEAIDLWSAGAIDPITFFKRLDSPDPVEDATNLLIWQMVQKGQLPPTAYIPNFMANQGGMPQQPGAPMGAPQEGGSMNPNLPTSGPTVPAPANSQPADQAQAHALIQSVPTH